MKTITLRPQAGTSRVNLDASRRLSRELRAADKDCFANSVRALSRLGPAARYVEGYAVSPHGMVVHHGWLEDEDGSVIETTPAWLRDTDEGISVSYFAARRWDLASVVTALDACSAVPLVTEEYREPVFQRAMLSAWRVALGPVMFTFSHPNVEVVE